MKSNLYSVLSQRGDADCVDDDDSIRAGLIQCQCEEVAGLLEIGEPRTEDHGVCGPEQLAKPSAAGSADRHDQSFGHRDRDGWRHLGCRGDLQTTRSHSQRGNADEEHRAGCFARPTDDEHRSPLQFVAALVGRQRPISQQRSIEEPVTVARLVHPARP